MSSPNGSQSFRVELSGEVSQRIKEAYEIAASAGIEASFLSALRRINDRLRKDPDVFGEPRYNLKHLGLQVRIAVINPCAVSYGVNLQARKVYVNGFRTIEGA